MDFATELKKQRIQKGMSVYMLSKLSGVPKSTIFNYEQGVNPTLERADKLLKTLGISITLGTRDCRAEQTHEQNP